MHEAQAPHGGEEPHVLRPTDGRSKAQRLEHELEQARNELSAW